MTGLPKRLYNECCQILSKCDVFDSDRSLQALFAIEELVAFKGNIPEASIRNQRIEQCLAYLTELYSRNNEPVLPIFLRVLRDRYQSGNALYDQLEELQKKVHFALEQSIETLDKGQLESLRQELLSASQGLLNWPRTLGCDRQIDRPEFTELLGYIEREDYSTTLILGDPGTGKSALLASLAHYCRKQKIAVLGIKADKLSQKIETLENLSRFLNLSKNPDEIIKAIAKQETVVLIIDQLDAISELLDRKTERLNILLNLIQSLSKIRNVHIVSSSREFEFRHDVRLTCIKAERLDLKLPRWEQLAPILTETGHTPNNLGTVLRELLRTPLHLKLFLEVAQPNEEFRYLRLLLSRLWEKHVINAPKDRLDLLEKLAEKMSQEEEIWLPIAICDRVSEARNALIQADILSDDGSERIGFRHQTYYDYTLARSFAEGSISLSDEVLQKQHGLFIRPVLLSGLNYLREAARSEYHRQVKKLLDSKLRPHIYTLILELIGSQKKPDDIEFNLIVPLLYSETEAPRILRNIAASPGWFSRLKNHESLEKWLQKPPEFAGYCSPLLHTAARSFSEDVVEIIEEFWFDDPAYDNLGFSVFFNLKQWSPHAVYLVNQIIQRSAFEDFDTSISHLIKNISQTSSELAIEVLRADLDRQLANAIQKMEQPLPPFSPDTDEATRSAHTFLNRPIKHLKALFESSYGNFEELKFLAKNAPYIFLDRIWLWLLDILDRIPREEYSTIISYCEYTTFYYNDPCENSSIVNMIAIAVSELAKQDIAKFLDFLEQNIDSDLMMIHRLLAKGLEQIAIQNPERVLEYLLGDARRLTLGNHYYHYGETKNLITAVFSHLSECDRICLENAVINFQEDTDYPEDIALVEQYLVYERKSRLRLLRAFPEENLSASTKNLKDVEEQDLPDTKDRDLNVIPTMFGSVKPRMNVDDMALASDEDLLILLTSDSSCKPDTGQLADEFEKLAQHDPDRVAHLIQCFQPNQQEFNPQELYASYGIYGLAQTDFPANHVMELIQELDNRGFASEYFRDRVASGLKKIAESNDGLPRNILILLETWLSELPESQWSEDAAEMKNRKSLQNDSLLFGWVGGFSYPSKPTEILKALTYGYLYQKPSDVEGWMRIIETQLNREKNPSVWAAIFTTIPILLNGDREQATQIFDLFIQTHPAILRYPYVSITIYNQCNIRLFTPRETTHKWLEKLLADRSELCHQIYGELLFSYYACIKDEWSEQEIRDRLTCDESDQLDIAILNGLAYAASHWWHYKSCQDLATEILCTLASHPSQYIQKAVTQVFFTNKDCFKLNSKMKKIVRAVAKNPLTLMESARGLIALLEPLTGTEPEIVSLVCENILHARSYDTNNPSKHLSSRAENLTNIALTLHRQPNYREKGLQIFEQLLASNLYETRVALETLDRKPTSTSYLPPR